MSDFGTKVLGGATLGCSVCSLESPGCFTIKLSEAWGNGIGSVAAVRRLPFLMDAVRRSFSGTARIDTGAICSLWVAAKLARREVTGSGSLRPVRRLPLWFSKSTRPDAVQLVVGALLVPSSMPVQPLP